MRGTRDASRSCCRQARLLREVRDAHLEAPKKKEKAKAAPATEAETPAAPVKAEKAAAKAEKKAKTEQGEKAAEQPQEGAKELKTQKKEKKVKEPKAAEKKLAEDAGEPSPSMIDLRVGHIVDSKYFAPATWIAI